MQEIKPENNSDNENLMAGNFIHNFIDEDIAEGGQYAGQTVHTRFPPEPNGYLHIGHAKAICIDFGTAIKYNGVCNLRMDDTNPAKEDQHYIEMIKDDIHWLGFDWEDRFYHASDYFQTMYTYALALIEKGLAYVDDLSAEEIRAHRGSLTTAGKNSPCRERSISENLELFQQMKAGKFQDGEKTLRAKIDMAAGNINMRDPVIYRISHEWHHRTENDWCIYPMYDFAHPLEDAIEGITHSLCSLEFEDHRPLYNWFIEHCPVPHVPRQIEFARLNINYTVMSKRKLRYLVEEKLVDGWDDPRLPTLSGLRRRGYSPKSIRNFCDRIGVSKVDSVVDHAFLEYCLREDLNENALRAMAVLDPIKLIIENYPETKTETFLTENHPSKPELGQHEVPFSHTLWIERDDFMEVPAKKYFRLFPGNEVRLKAAYVIKCTGCQKDANGNIIAVTATYDPDSRGGNPADGRKVKGTIHWTDSKTAINAEIRLYDRLFTAENPDQGDQDYLALLNPNSLQKLTDCKLEPWLANRLTLETYQFMRLGYFCLDKASTPDQIIYNRSVSLRDSYKP